MAAMDPATPHTVDDVTGDMRLNYIFGVYDLNGTSPYTLTALVFSQCQCSPIVDGEDMHAIKYPISSFHEIALTRAMIV